MLHFSKKTQCMFDLILVNLILNKIDFVKLIQIKSEIIFIMDHCFRWFIQDHFILSVRFNNIKFNGQDYIPATIYKSQKSFQLMFILYMNLSNFTGLSFSYVSHLINFSLWVLLVCFEGFFFQTNWCCNVCCGIRLSLSWN